MTTTSVEIGVEIGGLYVHDDDEDCVYVVLERVRVWVDDDEWEDGVRYREHGDGGRGLAYVRPEWRFEERFTKVAA